MATRTLVLMRHAKSDWSGDVPDLDRPIGSRGRRQARESGRWLAEQLPDLELAITSPAERARATWREASAAYDELPRTRVDERAYTFSDTGLVAVLRGLDDTVGSAMLVAHNPALDELVARLTGEYAAMVTSALAVLRFDGRWRDLTEDSCALVAHGRPPTGPLT